MKPSDLFDNSETKIRNREICLEQVSRFRVLFTRPPVVTIDKIINFVVVFAKPCDRLETSKLYSVFGSGVRKLDIQIRKLNKDSSYLASQHKRLCKQHSTVSDFSFRVIK